MSKKSDSRELIWSVIGALAILTAFVTGLYLRGNRDPIAQISLKDKCLAIVGAMRLSLAAASEAQNSAVMASKEEDSKKFVEDASSAEADLEHGRIELEQLLKIHPDPKVGKMMERVGQSFLEFQQIQKQVLDLAVQNSNRQASKLAFGPAMKLLKEMDEALARISKEYVESAANDKLQVVELAGEARIGIFNMQVMLPPHIAEASDEKMDEIEKQLAGLDGKVRENLAALRHLLPESTRSNIEATEALYAQFESLKSQIVKLSRQNTDLRAVAIALTEKRRAMVACQDTLGALEQAIRAEPVTSTIPSGRSP